MSSDDSALSTSRSSSGWVGVRVRARIGTGISWATRPAPVQTGESPVREYSPDRFDAPRRSPSPDAPDMRRELVELRAEVAELRVELDELRRSLGD